jgi:hypothetical protein
VSDQAADQVRSATSHLEGRMKSGDGIGEGNGDFFHEEWCAAMMRGSLYCPGPKYNHNQLQSDARPLDTKKVPLI